MKVNYFLKLNNTFVEKILIKTSDTSIFIFKADISLSFNIALERQFAAPSWASRGAFAMWYVDSRRFPEN